MPSFPWHSLPSALKITRLGRLTCLLPYRLNASHPPIHSTSPPPPQRLNSRHVRLSRYIKAFNSVSSCHLVIRSSLIFILIFILHSSFIFTTTRLFFIRLSFRSLDHKSPTLPPYRSPPSSTENGSRHYGQLSRPCTTARRNERLGRHKPRDTVSERLLQVVRDAFLLLRFVWSFS
jgi:hypothetical protein